jgi:PAS domain-containing protein
MIIRLLRGTVPVGREGPLVERLRSLELDTPPPGFIRASFGFRRSETDLGFVALTTWDSIESIARVTAGSPGGAVPSQPPGRELEHVSVDLYEAADESLVPPDGDAAALGLIWGKVAPHAEAAAHEMIRAIAPGVVAAGVRGIHVGRRMVEGQSELLVIASWRDRLALHAFARQRSRGAIDPEFLKLLTDWRFETYDCLAPGTPHLAPAGPAVLLADDTGRYVDASPAVEAILGLPAELVLGRTLAEFTPSGKRGSARTAWLEFLDAGCGEGNFDLLRPDGRVISVVYRAVANCPAPGIHASVLSLPDGPIVRGPVADIVAELFPSDAVVAA